MPELIDFLKHAFHAEERERMTTPDGRVSHAEVKIGDSIIMMGEPTGDSKTMPGMIYLYLENTDAAYRRAIDAGATSLREPSGMFYVIDMPLSPIRGATNGGLPLIRRTFLLRRWNDR